MKTRTGFVSNSSSSSFILALDKKPKNAAELASVLYPDHVGVVSPYGESHIDALTAAQAVWEQIKDQKPMTKSKVCEEIESGYFEGHPDYPFNGKADEIAMEYRKLTGKSLYDEDTPKEWKDRHAKVWKEEVDAYSKACSDAAKALGEQLLKRDFKGKKLFRCSFSDNDGSFGCTMEHGETFRHVPFTRISHH